MGKIKVWIDRDGCIADMVCINLCPEVFDADEEDGKSLIVEKWRVDPNDPSTGIVPEELRECVENAAESCPVAVIHIEEVE